MRIASGEAAEAVRRGTAILDAEQDVGEAVGGVGQLSSGVWQ